MKQFLTILKIIVAIAIFAGIAILLSQVILYDYASNDKTIAKSVTYERTDDVNTALSSKEDLDTEATISFTDEETQTGQYEVTNSDLNNYEKTNVYTPGKVNPFATYSTSGTSTDDDDDDTATGTDDTDSDTDTTNNSSSSSTSSSTKTTTNTTTTGLTK